jgi:hypothetical protein
MSRVKFSALGVMVVMMMMGIATASASALEFKHESTACTGGAFVGVCWETNEKGATLKEAVGEEEFSATSTGSVLTGTLGGSAVTVTCTGGSNTVGGVKKGLIVQNSPLTEDLTLKKVQFEFTGCTQTAGSAKCKVASPIILNESSATAENLAGGLSENWLRFKAENAQGIFAEIKFENNGTEKCPETIAGKQPVKGEQWCEWSSTAKPILEDLAEHQFTCASTEGTLTLGANAATFQATFGVTLAHTPFWDIEETV